MAGAGRVYVFDTSAFIAAWVEQYPPDAFPAFWERLETLVDADRLLCPDEVLNELGKIEDDPHAWLKERADKIVRELSEPVQIKASEVLNQYPRLTAAGGTRGKADPFVIALALVEGATVVTKERPGSVTRPKIPDACGGFNVPCFNVLQVIREEKWTFGR